MIHGRFTQDIFPHKYAPILLQLNKIFGIKLKQISAATNQYYYHFYSQDGFLKPDRRITQNNCRRRPCMYDCMTVPAQPHMGGLGSLRVSQGEDSASWVCQGQQLWVIHSFNILICPCGQVLETPSQNWLILVTPKLGLKLDVGLCAKVK